MTTETNAIHSVTTINQRMFEIAKGHLGAKDWELSLAGESLVIFRPVKNGYKKAIVIYKMGTLLEFTEQGKQPLTCTLSIDEHKELLGYAIPIDLSSF